MLSQAMSFRTIIDPEWELNLPRDPEEFIENEKAALDESLPVVDRLLEPQTIGHFLEFACVGTLPTGEITTIPLLMEDVHEQYLLTPYEMWAPGPHDKFGGSVFDHAMIRIGSEIDSDRLLTIEKGVQETKSRLWEGIPPISETRWRKKCLSDPANHHLACRQIGQVIEIFAYLQHPQVSEMLTETYSLIREHFSDFDSVVNRIPERADKPLVRLADLWETFMTAHYTAMTTRAHSWVIKRTGELRDLYEHLLTTIAPPASGDYSNEQMTVMNRLQDLTELALRADYTMFIHMPISDPPVSRRLPQLEERRQQTAQAVRQRSRQAIIQDTLLSAARGAPITALNTPTSMLQSGHAQRQAQDVVRLELRGETPQLPPESWIVSLIERMAEEENKQWGFPVYRLTYNASDGKWAEFVRKFEADLNDWGEGQLGADSIKDMARLHWIDGKEIGIPENDIHAARRRVLTGHFISLQIEEEAKYWYDEVFLAVDSCSFDSYMCSSPFSNILLPGDTGGFVNAVDTAFDPEGDGGRRGEESPLYPGHLRILGDLVYSDLYAMIASQASEPEALWPLAMNHPELIYTGPTVKAQVDHWKKITLMKLKLVECLGEHVGAISATGALGS